MCIYLPSISNADSFVFDVVASDDEHVAKADKKHNPRARLMDAIEQDCSLCNIDYLVKAFDIDVASFQDLVL